MNPARATNKREDGAMVLLVSIMATALLGMAALAVDIGLARSKRFDLQVAADAGALSAIRLLTVSGVTMDEIRTEARLMALQNSPGATVTAEVGRWTGSTFLTGNGVAVNAVRVVATESVPTAFAKIWRIFSTEPLARAIAMNGGSNDVNCVIPFGIEDRVIRNSRYGDTLDLSRASAGNWGKLDIDGNMSNGNAFVTAMTSGFCSRTISIGDQISPGTGFARVDEGFEQRRQLNPIVIMPIVSGFSNGNSQPVIVRGFIVARLISQGQGNGARWTGRIQFLNDYVGNSIFGNITEPLGQGRQLVF